MNGRTERTPQQLCQRKTKHRQSKIRHDEHSKVSKRKTKCRTAPIPLPLLRPTRGCPRRGEVWVREGKWRWYAVIFKLVA